MNFRFWFLWFGLMCCELLALGQDNTPKYSNEFLAIGVDARAFGMANSMVSHTSDVSAGYWNPAGLVGMSPNYQLGLMHSSYFGGISNYDYGAFAMKLEDSAALSVSILRFSVDDIADTRFLFDANGSVNYDNIRFFSASDYGFLTSYSRQLAFLQGLRIGGSAKVIRRIVGDFATSWGFGLDVGAQLTWKQWNFGLVGRDLFGTFNSWAIADDELADTYAQTGNALTSQSLEITLPRFILGASRTFSLINDFTVLASVDITATTDGKRNTLLKSEVLSLDPAFGLEVGYKSIAYLRGGVGQIQEVKDFNGSKSWTYQPNVGLGFRIREVAIDYAFTDIGDHAAALYSHVFSLKVDFDVED
ncbi:putative type IX sorting system protein PorV2 [Marinoscillum furvescens]|uniref:PorV/PorQ family protein n=1 Tax=Marinoscillum furvescens DSM 4134 TaxID=1122208 RepID=A0A3D9L604_MARFU|nr:PorV/PorQ family protein [Marinoscillum furvescens]RED99441.1 hypothetical protein C7460_10857 [Marinoscillum furvescens DSM 4134]